MHGFRSCIDFNFNQVEVRRFELLSKHILQKLSTCLFVYWLSGENRKTTNRFSP